MPSEPEWSKKISDSSVCTWFYALAIINAFFAIAGITLILLSKKVHVYSLISTILGSTIGFTNAWFLFMVCNRGLNPHH